MSSEVRITRQQAQAHYADLLGAIGATPLDPDHRAARRNRRREARRTAQRHAWLRRVARA